MHLQEYVPLAPYTTLRIGGPARYFARATTEAELLEAIQFSRQGNLPIFVLGGGSNLVVPDEGFPGVVIQIALDTTGNTFEVSAGEDWDHFVRTVCEQGVCGVECLAGIPGVVGGSPVQNIGAYGQEVASTIQSVRALDLEALEFVSLANRDCQFAYRHSIFNSTHRGHYIVTRVNFLFDRNAKPNLTYADLASLRDRNPTPLDVYHFVRQIRDRKGMLIDAAHPHPDSRSAGSFFKNPIVPPAALDRITAALDIPAAEIPNWPTPTGEVKLPAAWLIERAGFPKGFELGPVGISTRHTLALVNRTGDASCADLLKLRDLIISTVLTRFGIALEQEPVLLGR